MRQSEKDKKIEQLEKRIEELEKQRTITIKIEQVPPVNPAPHPDTVPIPRNPWAPGITYYPSPTAPTPTPYWQEAWYCATPDTPRAHWTGGHDVLV